VCTVFFLTAAAWMGRPILDDFLPGLSDAGIAVIAALCLFLLPVDTERGVNVIGWNEAKGVPWDVLVLFGGGLSLAAAISQTGLADWIGGNLTSLAVIPVMGMIALITVLIIFLSEFTSNTATAAAFLPVVGSLAIALGVDPILLTAPAALAANSGFMMPVGTPPNAIVYATGRVTMMQMIRVGFYLNVIFALLITIFAMTVVPAIFG
jgi:sodium-dependent dicarboxylate transporter 2/3/5